MEAKEVYQKDTIAMVSKLDIDTVVMTIIQSMCYLPGAAPPRVRVW